MDTSLANPSTLVRRLAASLLIATMLASSLTVLAAASARHAEAAPPPDSPAGEIVSLTPARLLETRVGPANTTIDGISEGAGRTPAGQVVEVVVAGRGGVPATGVGGAVLNLAVIQPATKGYATVFPCGEPPLASSINFERAVGAIANEVVAKLSPSGSVCVFTNSTTDLGLDVVAE